MITVNVKCSSGANSRRDVNVLIIRHPLSRFLCDVLVTGVLFRCDNKMLFQFRKLTINKLGQSQMKFTH